MSWRNDPDYEKKMAEVIAANRRAVWAERLTRVVVVITVALYVFIFLNALRTLGLLNLQELIAGIISIVFA